MSVQIITDSHSGITRREAKQLGLLLLSMPFTVNGVERLERDCFSHKELFSIMAEGGQVSTSQASPAPLLALWDKALERHDQVVYIPLSSGLSGSCATAKTLAMAEPYAGRVFVVDNGRISTPLYRSVLDAIALANAGHDGAQIQKELEASRADMSIYVAASTLEYLKRGGRVSATSAAVGTLLGIRPVLHLDVGVLSSFKNARGLAGTKRVMIDALRHDLETRFRFWYESGEVHLLAATNTDKAATEEWIMEIEAAFPGMTVLHSNLSLGISCHIGPGAMGIGCSCVPEALRGSCNVEKVKHDAGKKM